MESYSLKKRRLRNGESQNQTHIEGFFLLNLLLFISAIQMSINLPLGISRILQVEGHILGYDESV